MAGAAGYGATVMGNQNGYIDVQPTELTKAQWMDLYDSLPAGHRQVLQNAPYNLNFRKILDLYWLQEAIVRIKSKSILETYGEDHPNYKKIM